MASSSSGIDFVRVASNASGQTYTMSRIESIAPLPSTDSEATSTSCGRELCGGNIHKPARNDHGPDLQQAESCRNGLRVTER